MAKEIVTVTVAVAAVTAVTVPGPAASPGLDSEGLELDS
jgi:hypothetical protein